jgi:hypothetical protein
MSLDEFNRVTTGMTYDQVVEVVGGPGEQQSHFESGGFSSESYKRDVRCLSDQVDQQVPI